MKSDNKRKIIRLSVFAAPIIALAICAGFLNSGTQGSFPDVPDNGYIAVQEKVCTFRSTSLRDEHYAKHGVEMGFASAEEYENAASKVVNDPSSLHKTEAEDGDDVYYLEATNEFVIVSTDGFIRTYFYPDDGKSYFDRQ